MAGVHRDLEELQTSYGVFEGSTGFQTEENEAPNIQYSSTNLWNHEHLLPKPKTKEHGDQEQPPGGVIIHTVTEESKSRWSHIDDLDSFFKNVYTFHQRGGFKVMFMQKILDLTQVLFILVFSIYLFDCVNYDVLFNNKMPEGKKPGEKVVLSDVLSSFGQCSVRLSPLTWLFLLIGASFWIVKLLASSYQLFQFWDIKHFYNQALHIDDSELDSVTWREVQKRLVEAQKDHSMCIHKDQLTDLDIYHRILRYKNYLVAMINKGILPVRISVLPCLPSIVFFSQGLKFNLEWLFFKGPWAAFDKWHLKDDYKKLSKKSDLTCNMKYRIVILATVNFLFMPLIFFWQVLYCFFNYAELIKREPGSLGVRRWSQYGKLYLRHLNELDHELKSRLNRAYKPANQYMEIFVSPMSVVVAKFFAFMAGSVLAVFIALSIWDEDVLNVEHVLTIITVLGSIIAVCRVFLPDENMIFCPEKTLTAVIAHIHYFPVDDWKGRAHTYDIMNHLNDIFPYTALALVQELMSPILTPFILLLMLRPRSRDVIDFFRNFTVDVTGVGDVCSFAQMDVRRHGNPDWQSPINEEDEDVAVEDNTYARGEAGKTEMSLIHFTLANPNWQPPPESASFIAALKQQTTNQVDVMPFLAEDQLETNPLYSSLTALENVGGVYTEIAQDLLQTSGIRRRIESSLRYDKDLQSSSMLRSIMNRNVSTANSIMPPPPNLRQDLKRLGLEYLNADMSLSALYLHEIRQNKSCHTSANIKHQKITSDNLLNEVAEEECLPLVNTDNFA